MRLLREIYGSNFLLRLKEYTVLNDEGLPNYAVHFSEYAKWGINVREHHFPIGVWFYFLHPNAFESGASGNGFATDRKYANIARLRLEKFAIISDDSKLSFTKESRIRAIEKLKLIYGPDIENDAIWNLRKEFRTKSASEFSYLFSVILGLTNGSMVAFNKILHLVGYDGILDFANDFLPIEGFQGVETWPGATEYIESIRKDKSNPNQNKRVENAIRRLMRIPNGSLKLNYDEFMEFFRTFKRNLNYKEYEYESRDGVRYFIEILLKKVDLSNVDFSSGTLDWLAIQIFDWNADELFFNSFEANPTTPKELWRRLISSRYEDVRLAAKDHLNE